MDNQAEEESTSANVDYEDCSPLSPIMEMEESSIIEDDPKIPLSEGEEKSSLETSLSENIDARTRQPRTPPEVLRVRLDSLQSELEELKEFTDLERQTYHSDCIPKDQVQSLEQDLASLNDKLHQLMQENAEYKNQLANSKTEQSVLKSHLLNAWKLQNVSVIIIGKIEQTLKDGGRLHPMVNELDFLSPFPCIEKYEEDFSQAEAYEQKLLNSFKSLENAVDISINDHKKMKDKVEDLQSEIFELNELIENLEDSNHTYEKNLESIKYNCNTLENKLSVVEAELAQISIKLLESETKQIEERITKDMATKATFELKREMDKTQEHLLFMTDILNGALPLLNDKIVIESSCVALEDILSFQNILSDSCNLDGISRALIILVHVLKNLKNEITLKLHNCLELELNVKELNEHFRSFEKEVSQRKKELKLLEDEVHQKIPSKLVELESSLKIKGEENHTLKYQFDASFAKQEELTNKLTKMDLKLNQLQGTLITSNNQNTNLKNELHQLMGCKTVDSIQNQIFLVLKYVDNVIDTWDEKTGIESVIRALHANEEVLSLITLLMNSQNQTVFYEIVKKSKIKLLCHEMEINNSNLNLNSLVSKIDFLQTENRKLKLEIDALDEIVRGKIENKLLNLEKLLNSSNKEIISSVTAQTKYREENNILLLNLDDNRNEDAKVLKLHDSSFNKLEKELNNLNKAAKTDDESEIIVSSWNEIKKLINSWQFFGKDQVVELMHHIRESLQKLWHCQNPLLKPEVLLIINTFEAKLVELFEINSINEKLIEKSNMSFSNQVEDYENKQVNKFVIEDFKCKNCGCKSKGCNNPLYEDKIENESVEQIKAFKNLIVLEITSLDSGETEESLLGDSLQNLFNKLMEIIMKKEHEMSNSIHEQQKEEFHNLESTIEKMNNKLKSQESWTEALESENEKINTELLSVKSLNTVMDNKLKSLMTDLRNKNLEVSNMNRTILDLKIENESLLTNLDSAKALVNEHKSSINSLKEDIERLNKDVLNRSNIIKHLESQLNAYFLKEQEGFKGEIKDKTTIYTAQNAKGDFSMNEVNCRINSVALADCPDLVKDQREIISSFETPLSESIRKEIALVTEILAEVTDNTTFHELFSKRYDELDVLKDLIQTIGSKILAMEMKYLNDIQSKQTELDQKTKELRDLKLSISKLHKDFDPKQEELDNKAEINYDSFNQGNITVIHKEVESLKYDCLNISNLAEDQYESAKRGQSVIQSIREIFSAVVHQNKSLTSIKEDLQKSIATVQKKLVLAKLKSDRLFKEKKALETTNARLEHKIKGLKSKLSEMKTNLLSELELQFPNNLSDNEKVVFVNETLKQYLETQNVCYNVTENLRFFGYQSELMLSYIQNMEYKFYSILQQKNFLSEENTSLKEQITMQNLEMNKYVNLIVSNSLIKLNSHQQALDVISHVFSEHKVLTRECEVKEEKIAQQQKEMTLLTNENSSLKFEFNKCEESVRNLRSELRNLRVRQRRESMNFHTAEVKQEKTDISVQTDGSCCKRLLKKVMEQKDDIDMLTAKLSKRDQQRSLETSNPYNKQVTYLEGALDQAKGKIRSLKLELNRQESKNQELMEALKRHESCQQRFNDLHLEIEKLKNIWHSK